MPAFADGTMLLKNGIEKNEPKNAADIEKDNAEHDCQHNERNNQNHKLAYAGWVEVAERQGRSCKFIGAPRMRIAGKIKSVEIAAAGVEFGG